MRVAVFTDNDFAQVNGVTTTLTALLSHAPDDISPRIYTASTLASDQPDYLALRSPSVPIPFRTEMQIYVPHCAEYLRRVRANAVDVLHLTTPGPLGLTALWIAKRTGLPLVGSFHTKFGTSTSLLRGSSRLGAWMDDYMGWMYGRCRRVLVPCAAARDALMHRGVPWQQLTIWPSGVDTDRFRPSRRSATLRQEWRAGEDHPVLLYVGRVSRDKGLDLLPALLRQLRALGVVCRMVVVGDGPLRRWLADACPETIFTGVLGRDAVADVFASADLFLLPSRTDTAGNVVLEAQASGLPVIVSDRGGLREQVVSDITGRICGGADPSRWANVANELLRNRDLLSAMGKAARSYALTRRWNRALEPLFETYRTVSAVPAVPVIDFLHADHRVVTRRGYSVFAGRRQPAECPSGATSTGCAGPAGGRSTSPDLRSPCARPTVHTQELRAT